MVDAVGQERRLLAAVDAREQTPFRTFRRLRAAICPESVIRDHLGYEVEHDAYVRPILRRVLEVRQRDAELIERSSLPAHDTRRERRWQ